MDAAREDEVVVAVEGAGRPASRGVGVAADMVVLSLSQNPLRLEDAERLQRSIATQLFPPQPSTSPVSNPTLNVSLETIPKTRSASMRKQRSNKTIPKSPFSTPSSQREILSRSNNPAPSTRVLASIGPALT